VRQVKDGNGGTRGASGEHRKKSGPSADEGFAKAAVADRVYYRLSLHEIEKSRAGKGRKLQAVLEGL
jgi:hypothetical protein